MPVGKSVKTLEPELLFIKNRKSARRTLEGDFCRATHHHLFCHIDQTLAVGLSGGSVSVLLPRTGYSDSKSNECAYLMARPVL
jgi:hypothetical protein